MWNKYLTDNDIGHFCGKGGEREEEEVTRMRGSGKGFVDASLDGGERADLYNTSLMLNVGLSLRVSAGVQFNEQFTRS